MTNTSAPLYHSYAMHGNISQGQLAAALTTSATYKSAYDNMMSNTTMNPGASLSPNLVSSLEAALNSLKINSSLTNAQNSVGSLTLNDATNALRNALSSTDLSSLVDQATQEPFIAGTDQNVPVPRTLILSGGIDVSVIMGVNLSMGIEVVRLFRTALRLS